MASCQGCSADLSSQDRFCKNCGAPVAVSFEDLADTRPFDPSARTDVAAPTGSLDTGSPPFVSAPSTYPLAQSSAPLTLTRSFIKHRLSGSSSGFSALLSSFCSWAPGPSLAERQSALAGHIVPSWRGLTVPPFQPKANPRDQGFLGIGDAARRCCVGDTRRWGLEVRRIIDNSPADLAGLQPGDIITELDHQTIRTPDELARRIRAVKPRTKVKIEFYRANSERTVEPIIGHGW